MLQLSGRCSAKISLNDSISKKDLRIFLKFAAMSKILFTFAVLNS
jgi:hypothetical protein